MMSSLVQVSNDEYQSLEDLRKAVSDNLLENSSVLISYD